MWPGHTIPLFAPGDQDMCKLLGRVSGSSAGALLRVSGSGPGRVSIEEWAEDCYGNG